MQQRRLKPTIVRTCYGKCYDITHFAYEECDRRLAQDSLQPEQLQKTLSAGYVVYMAFKYE